MPHLLICTMPKSFLIPLLWLISTTLHGQGRLDFSTKAISFGAIREENGTVQARFRYKNAGNKAVRLISVSASCGCTTPKWSMEPIHPGDTGSILATFNPLGRGGAFKKDITVMADGDPGTATMKPEGHELVISGQVIERQRTPAEIYPDTLGPWVRLQSRNLNLGQADPTVDVPVVREFTIHNAHNKRIAVNFYPAKNMGATVVRRWPAHVRIEAPASVDAHQSAVIKVHMNPARRFDFGYLNDYAILEANDGETGYKRAVFLQAEHTLNPADPTLAINQNGPKLQLTFGRVLDFGKLVEGTELKMDGVALTNAGGKLLVVHAIKATGPMKVRVKRQTVAPGKAGTFGYTLNTKGLEGQQNHQMTFYTNDVFEPVIVVAVQFNVVKTLTP